MGFLKKLEKSFVDYLDNVYITNLAIRELNLANLKLTEINNNFKTIGTITYSNNKNATKPGCDLGQFIVEKNALKLEIKEDLKTLNLVKIKKIEAFIKKDLELTQKEIQDNENIASEEFQSKIINNMSGRTILEVCKTLIAEKTAEQGMEK